MSNNGITLYDGNPVWQTGLTPFGFYDNDTQFQQDAVRVARFCGSRLGYPIMDVELQDKNMFACFEEAVTTYGNQIYAWKVKENYLSLEGGSSEFDANGMVLEPSMQRVIEISKNYGTESEVGGNITLHKGLLPIKANVQEYDLAKWAKEQGIVGGIEIRKVFYQAPPAILRYFDPYAGTGTGVQSLMDAFDFGSYSPGVNFMLMPVSADLLKIQGIEFNDQVRKSGYSFKVSNNKLTLFPIPPQDGQLRIEYYKLSDKRKLNTGAVLPESTANKRMDFNVTLPIGSSSVLKVFDHYLNTEDVTVKAYEEVNGETVEFIPSSIDILDRNSIAVSFASTCKGYILIEYPAALDLSTKRRMNFTNTTAQTFNHNLNSTNITVQVFEDDGVHSPTVIIPQDITIVDKNNVRVTFTQATSGYIVIGFNYDDTETDPTKLITNISEVPFKNPTYSKINSVGRQWIFKYTLALCKEVLAYIRGKYQNLPIPDATTTLNQSDLLTDARAEKEALIKELTDMLDATSRQKQLENKANETDYLQKTLTGIPMTIYIG